MLSDDRPFADRLASLLREAAGPLDAAIELVIDANEDDLTPRDRGYLQARLETAEVIIEGELPEFKRAEQIVITETLREMACGVAPGEFHDDVTHEQQR